MFGQFIFWLRRLWPVVSEEERIIRRELMFHLDRLTEEFRAKGMSKRSARREALKKFGQVGHVEQAVANEDGIGEFAYKGDGTLNWKNCLNDLGQDVRYGLRSLRKSPGFTTVAVLTLALGIGANIAIFSVVNAVLLEPLPYPQPEELAIVWQEHEEPNLSRLPSSALQLRLLKENSDLFSDLGGIWATTGTLAGDRDPEQIKLGMVTANFLSVLGVQPGHGRHFLPEEEAAGRPVAVILSHSLWKRRYGADPSLVGKTVRFQGLAVNVVGVMPEGFQMPFPADASVPDDIQVWTPFVGDIYAGPVGLYYVRILGRLRPGVKVTDADAEASAIAADLRSDFLEYAEVHVDLEVSALHQDSVRHIQPALLALLVGVALVLLIACVNVANLLIARASERRKEIVVRLALGANRFRIVRQLLTESLLLAGLGGIAGLGLGYLLSRILHAFQPMGLLPASNSQLSLTVAIFAVTTTFGCGVLFSLFPVLETGRFNLTETLREGARDLRGRGWVSRGLVVAEVSIGFVLLMGAGLLAQTFVNLLSVDPGFQAEGVLTFELGLPEPRYPADADRLAFFRQLRDNLSGQPSVESVGAISHLPLDDFPNWYSPYAPEGTVIDGASPSADHRATAAGYFETMGVTLVSGRFFDRSDENSGRSVIVIDEVLARQAWPGEDAVGKRLQVAFIREWNFENDWAEVVGVIKHIHHHALDVQLRGQIYVPYPLAPRPHQSFVLRTQGDPRALIPIVRREVAKLDSGLAVSTVQPMSYFLEKSTEGRRFTLILGVAFAGLALVLAAIGIYGVVAHSVERRTREFGIRMAIGAQRPRLLWTVLSQGLVLAGIGIGLGLVGSRLATPFLASLVYGVSPIDGITQLVAAGVLVGVALAGCMLPALRATRINPMVALRYE